jgi:hypothetical protein
VGVNAGAISQGQRALALGSLAGTSNQGEAAIAIGNFAAPNNQAPNSIVISATGTGLENATTSSLVIAPIRNISGGDGLLQYNNTTKEVSYSNQFTGSLLVTGSFVVTNGITGSTNFDTIVNKPTLISGSVQVLGGSGVYSSSAQIQGNIYTPGSSFTFQDLLLGAGTTFGKVTTDGSKYISVMPTYNVESARFWTNGNVTIQTGGDYVDNGFRLEVGGSAKIVGDTTITGSLIHGLEGNIATGEYSHAEGSITKAIGNYSHAEGDFTQAKGDYSHAEGQETIASGSYSHAEGYQTIALGQRQHVTGQYNFVSPIQSAFIVGNGIDDSNRSNLIYAAENAVEITGSLNVLGNQTINGSLIVTDIIQGTGSIYLQPDVSDARYFQIYNTAAPLGTDIHFKGNADFNYFGDDTNYLKIDDSAQTVSIVGVNGVEITGSLNISVSASIAGNAVVTSPSVNSIVTISSASYAALTPPVSGTLYIII